MTQTLYAHMNKIKIKKNSNHYKLGTVCTNAKGDCGNGGGRMNICLLLYIFLPLLRSF
jgi:hypothetical protein